MLFALIQRLIRVRNQVTTADKVPRVVPYGGETSHNIRYGLARAHKGTVALGNHKSYNVALGGRVSY